MVPDSEFSTVFTLDCPAYIKLLLIIIGLILGLFVLKNFAIVLEHPFIFISTFLSIYIFNIYIHEKCHQLAFELLTNQPAYIKIKGIQPYCKASAPCSVSSYFVVALSPFISVVIWSIIFALLFLISVQTIILLVFAAAVICSLLGMSCDIYWCLKIRNIPRDYFVMDYGTYAEVIKKK